jgi:hypothetical protein
MLNCACGAPKFLSQQERADYESRRSLFIALRHIASRQRSWKRPGLRAIHTICGQGCGDSQISPPDENSKLLHRCSVGEGRQAANWRDQGSLRPGSRNPAGEPAARSPRYRSDRHARYDAIQRALAERRSQASHWQARIELATDGPTATQGPRTSLAGRLQWGTSTVAVPSRSPRKPYFKFRHRELSFQGRSSPVRPSS